MGGFNVGATDLRASVKDRTATRASIMPDVPTLAGAGF
jgi:hypothetical protein